MSPPSFPNKRAELRDGVGGFDSLAGARGVAFSPSAPLLAIAAATDNAVTLVDVSAPASPVLRSALRDGQLGINVLAGATAVAFSTNNLLAVAAPTDNGVTILEVTNSASPGRLWT